jgi:hypothetical protein
MLEKCWQYPHWKSEYSTIVIGARGDPIVVPEVTMTGVVVTVDVGLVVGGGFTIAGALPVCQPIKLAINPMNTASIMNVSNKLPSTIYLVCSSFLPGCGLILASCYHVKEIFRNISLSQWEGEA